MMASHPTCTTNGSVYICYHEIYNNFKKLCYGTCTYSVLPSVSMSDCPPSQSVLTIRWCLLIIIILDVAHFEFNA